jgi:two-component system cell cycle sensor histidine kinase/response regulator CckA
MLSPKRDLTAATLFLRLALSASSGIRPRVIAAQHPEIDLLLTDVVMPGMSGPELMDQVRKSRPDLTVLFLSGYDH